MKRLAPFPLLLVALLVLTGFNIDNAIVPKDQIFSGGVPKDGIPAILAPKFITPGEAGFLQPDDQVIGVQMGGQAKAYPVRILNWHEVANDTMNGVPFVVTF